MCRFVGLVDNVTRIEEVPVVHEMLPAQSDAGDVVVDRGGRGGNCGSRGGRRFGHCSAQVSESDPRAIDCLLDHLHGVGSPGHGGERHGGGPGSAYPGQELRCFGRVFRQERLVLVPMGLAGLGRLDQGRTRRTRHTVGRLRARRQKQPRTRGPRKARSLRQRPAGLLWWL